MTQKSAAEVWDANLERERAKRDPEAVRAGNVQAVAFWNLALSDADRAIEAIRAFRENCFRASMVLPHDPDELRWPRSFHDDRARARIYAANDRSNNRTRISNASLRLGDAIEEIERAVQSIEFLKRNPA